MKAVTKLMTGAVGIAALVGMAAPAAAQYYPGYNNGSNVIGQVLNTILNPYGQQQYGYGQQQYGYGQQQYGYGQQQYGYGQQYGYAPNPQAAVSQCTAAVQSRIAQQYGARYGNNPYGGYSPYASTGGYSNARVVNITRVEPRSNATLRIRGNATSGRMAAYNPYGGYGGYNTAAAADLSFKCDVDYRGYIRDIDIDRRY